MSPLVFSVPMSSPPLAWITFSLSGTERDNDIGLLPVKLELRIEPVGTNTNNRN